MWVTSLIENGLVMPIKNVTFTRSMSNKLKVIVVSGEQVAVFN